MTGCCVNGCTKRYNKGFKMCRFPSHPNRRKIWENKVSRMGWKQLHHQSFSRSPSLKAAKATAKKPRAPDKTSCCLKKKKKSCFSGLREQKRFGTQKNKKAGYQKHVKQGLYEAQAKVMNKSAKHLIGWFKSVCDTNTKLIKKDKGKSGDGHDDDNNWSDRQRFIMASMKFIGRVVHHRPKPVRSVETIILEHSGNLDAAETAAAQEAADVD
ncbi:uncharacterized protein LOC117530236 [Thalassophryne amazonica]|uniref:uncharacterized protein LOC117530236 n=1 Tax=Thalassophryne amazonica TaxID=390379 RepID=UPI0014721991|nr:uncharacterized protein LOC117530236 [Thalassophryne amazonica]